MTRAKQVLVVDDDRYLLRLFSKAFQSAGYEVFSAAEMIEAEVVLAHQTPDLLVVDYGLPDGTGLDILQAVRSQSKQPIRSILITGNYLVRDMPEAAVADMLLLKPVSTRELVNAGAQLVGDDPAA